MDVSIILPTYNNAERLRITLRWLCQLNQPEGVEWELVAVNNNSTDDTEQVIESFSGRLPITYVYEPEQGISRAQNAGLNAAEGDLVVFTDDDVKPNPDWLIAYWEAYQEKPEGYYFGGPIESEFEGEPPDEDLLEVAMHSVSGLDYGPEPGKLGRQDVFIGANWACPSRHLRGERFNEDLGLNAYSEGTSVGEEIDLMKRLEKKEVYGWYIPDAKVKHFVPKKKSSIRHISKRMIDIEFKNESLETKKINNILGLPVGLYMAYLKRKIICEVKKIENEEEIEDYLKKERWKKRIELYYKYR